MSLDDPYEEQPTAPRKKSSSLTCLTLVLAGCGLGVIVLCCGGGFGIAWFGLNVLSAELEDKLRDNPAMKEHIGVVESFTFDLTRSAAHADNDAMVFRVKGSLGEGYVTVVSSTNAAGDEDISKATLRKADGTEVQLLP